MQSILQIEETKDISCLQNTKDYKKSFDQKQTQSSLIVSELKETKKNRITYRQTWLTCKLCKTILSDTESIETDNNNVKTIITEIEKKNQ